MLDRPGDERAAGEFGAVVCAYGAGVSPEHSRPIEQPGDVLAGDAVVDGDVHALVAEVVGHGQALQSPSVGQAVADEIHAPHLIDRPGQLQRHALAGGPANLLAFAHGQVGDAVQAVDALVVDARELRAQKIVDAPVTEAAPYMSHLDDPARQLTRRGVCLGRVAVAVAGEPHKTARSALGQMVFVDHHGDRLAPDLWG